MTTLGWKALFGKECRENGRWALLALLALSLGLAYAWSRLPTMPALGQVWSGENLVLTITTPLIGLALCLLQVLPERRRDQWAFLVHRPASRTALFFGKVLPGISLYLLATTLPLLGLAVWASSLSHIPAPFDFRFTLAGWAAILSGLPFYFAALLVALRPARWYGSRALPLLTVLIAPWAASEFHEFWQVALACLFVTAVLLCAAWGSFVSGGEYKEQTKPARFALGLTLYPTMLAVSLGVISLFAGAYNLLEGRSGSGGEWWRNEDKIDTQGRVFYSSEHGDDSTHMDKKTVTITDMAGHPVDPSLWQTLSRQHKWLDMEYLPIGASNGEDLRYSDPTRYVLDLSSTIDDHRQTYWYYAMAARQIVGYTVTNEGTSLIGYLGPQGFARDQQGDGQFAGPRPEPSGLAGLDLLNFPQALYYWSDTSAAVPIIGLLQATPGGNAVTTLSRNDNDQNQKTQVLIVAAGNQITAYMRGASGPPPAVFKLFTTPLAFNPKTDAYIQVAMTPDRSRFFFWHQVSGASQPSRLVTVAPDGHVLKSETIPPPVWPGTVPQMHPFVQALPALLVPAAATAALAGYAVVGHALKIEDAESWWRGADSGTLFPAVLFYSALGGLLAAVLVWRISRRCGDGRRGQLAWAFGAFWLGPYGVLLLLALRAWPARVPCPHCGRLRVVDRETCEHCGARFTRPRPDGTEVFDRAGEETVAR